MTGGQYATFEVADQLFGVPVADVQEVLAFHGYTPVPLAPASIGGLFNLRGEIIAAIDLRVQLGLAARDLDGPTMNVIVRTGEEPVSLLVDRIGEVVEVDASAFEPAPATLDGPARRFIAGTFKLEDGLMLTLDTAGAVDTTTYSSAGEG